MSKYFLDQLPLKGQQEKVAQDHVQPGLEYLHGQRLHNLLRQPIPVFNHIGEQC